MKCAQFGILNVHGRNAEMNHDRLKQEITDLHAILKIMESEAIFQFWLDSYKVEEKIERVNEWYDVSKSLGKVT